MTAVTAPQKVHTAGELASTAAQLVAADREASHGDKLENHKKIALVWNAILIVAGKRPEIALDAHDVANLMEGLKIARRYLGTFNIDDYVDGAGYAAVAGEIKSRQMEQARVDATWVAAALEGAPGGPDPAAQR